MAYIGTEHVKEIRNKIKQEFGPEYKWSVTNEHHTGISIALLVAPVEYEKEYTQVNHYHIDSHYKNNPQLRDVLSKVVEIANSVKECKDRNFGDPTADYGDMTYFLNISIGKWNKPFKSINCN